MRIFFALVLLGASTTSMCQMFDGKLVLTTSIGLGPATSEIGYNIISQAPGNESSTASSRFFTSSLFYSNLALRIGYAYKGIEIGGATYRGTQKDSNVENIVHNDIRRVVTEDAEDWPNNKSYTGVYLAYNIRLADIVYIAPRVEYLKFTLTNKDTFVKNSIIFNNEFRYNDIFTNRSSVAFSLDFKFIATENQYFQAGFTHYRDSYDLSTSYVMEEITNLETNQSGTTFNLGYTFLFDVKGKKN